MSVLTGLNNLTNMGGLSEFLMKIWTPDFNLVEHLNEFQAQESPARKIDFVYNELHRLKMFPEFKEDFKCDQMSNMFRENGNKLYREGNYAMAYKEYVNAIAGAKTRKVLSLAYANRSMVLFKSGMYEQCVLDIDRARNLGYPRNRMSKLIERRNEALSKISSDQPLYHEATPEIPTRDKNTTIRNASKKIRIIKSDETSETHIIAAKNLIVGDILLVEKPYVTVATGLGLEDHCVECNELCFTLIPCDKCTHAMYCGEECKNRAKENGHKYECNLVKTITGFIPRDIGIHFYLALGMALKLRNSYEELYKKDESKRHFYESDYKEVFKLKSCLSYTLPLKQYQATMFMAQLFHLVKTYTSFFKEQPARSEDVFKDILFKVVFISNANIRSVTEVEDGSVVEVTSKILSNGLYPITNLFSYSCVPNVIPISYGNTMIAKVLRPIAQGEKCTIGKGLTIFHRASTSARQWNLFVDWNISCSCELCEGKWKIDLDVLEFDRIKNLCMVLETVDGTKNLADIKALIDYLPPLLEKSGQKDELDFTTFQTLTTALQLLGNNRLYSLNIK